MMRTDQEPRPENGRTKGSDHHDNGPDEICQDPRNDPRRNRMENKLAENIRSCRKNLGLTQEQLAERLGITLGTVSKWERGSSEPDLGYLMDLAELFHVSVDALIGFSLRGTDADAEADRLRELYETVPVTEMEAEFDSALMKFPNHFRIVYGAARCAVQIGVVYKRNESLKKALSLLRRSLELFSQNKDLEITEIEIRNEIAWCYSELKDYKKAVEEYKKNNLCGNNDAIIGMALIQREKKPEEGVRYTVRAFVNQLSEILCIMNGYLAYYLDTKNPERGVRAAEWTVSYLESLKEDPGKRCYLDKLISLYYMILASQLEWTGRTEEADRNLEKAVRIARAFDADPVFTLENMLFTEAMETTSFYDSTGPTAVEGMRNIVTDTAEYFCESFRKKLEKALA